jgi:hypothetical protein
VTIAARSDRARKQIDVGKWLRFMILRQCRFTGFGDPIGAESTDPDAKVVWPKVDILAVWRLMPASTVSVPDGVAVVEAERENGRAAAILIARREYETAANGVPVVPPLAEGGARDAARENVRHVAVVLGVEVIGPA